MSKGLVCALQFPGKQFWSQPLPAVRACCRACCASCSHRRPTAGSCESQRHLCCLDLQLPRDRLGEGTEVEASAAQTGCVKSWRPTSVRIEKPASELQTPSPPRCTRAVEKGSRPLRPLLIHSSARPCISQQLGSSFGQTVSEWPREVQAEAFGT